jgi:hypothetical protein
MGSFREVGSFEIFRVHAAGLAGPEQRYRAYELSHGGASWPTSVASTSKKVVAHPSMSDSLASITRALENYGQAHQEKAKDFINFAVANSNEDLPRIRDAEELSLLWRLQNPDSPFDDEVPTAVLFFGYTSPNISRLSSRLEKALTANNWDIRSYEQDEELDFESHVVQAIHKLGSSKHIESQAFKNSLHDTLLHNAWTFDKDSDRELDDAIRMSLYDFDDQALFEEAETAN